MSCRGLIFLGVLALASAIAGADRLILHDGTAIEGTVIPQQDQYWVRTPDGRTRLVPARLVKEHERAGVPTTAKSADFADVGRRVQAVESPLAAVALLQKFIDDHPQSPDLAQARQDLEHWQKLADDGAEKISGRWVGGEELGRIRARSAALLHEAADLSRQNKTLQAIARIEEAARVNPNSFVAHFYLGHFAAAAGKDREAFQYWERCLQLRPDSTEVLNNLAVLHWHLNQFDRALACFARAAVASDNAALAHNLAKAAAITPAGQRGNVHYRKVSEAATLLSAKYALRPNVDYARAPWSIAVLAAENANDRDRDASGVAASGSGFFISEDGLILTNRHVIEDGTTLLVVMSDGRRASAQVVARSDGEDLALIRIRAERPTPPATLATQTPAEGAQVFEMGYPLGRSLGDGVKITQGIVSGIRKSGPADLLLDAKVNPGNSGGPLLDAWGHVAGVVAMKTVSTAMVDSYGLAISQERVRRFLEVNKVVVMNPVRPGERLDAEKIAARLKPATVQILSVR